LYKQPDPRSLIHHLFRNITAKAYHGGHTIAVEYTQGGSERDLFGSCFFVFNVA